MKRKIKNLFYSLLIDGVGMLTYLIPGWGEIGDIIWSPISTALIYKLYDNLPLAIIGGIEEASPGGDFIPTATIAWINQYLIK